MQNIFDRLWSVAWNNSTELQSKHAAAIIYKGSVESIGVNSLKTHPLQQKYSKNTKAIHLHAEIDAIVKALKILSLKELENSTMVVTRVKYFFDPNDKALSAAQIWGNSEPCHGCKAAIEAFNIQRVMYTLDSPKNDIMYETLER
jgi:deoxycytidylate deaminase